LRAAVVLALPAAALGQPASTRIDPNDIVVRALAQLDVPYRHGGRTPAGFDCSGLVGYVVSESAGVILPRRSEDLARIGEPVDRGELAAGDLVFFNTLGRRHSHVGIYLGDGRFVHAPARNGRVRVERLTERYWAARYNGARRIASPVTQVATVEGSSGPLEVEAEAPVKP
jgi:cell wall-associated NlpC family hydrolase